MCVVDHHSRYERRHARIETAHMLVMDDVGNAIPVQKTLDHGQFADVLSIDEMHDLHRSYQPRPENQQQDGRDCTFVPSALDWRISYGVSVMRARRSWPGPPDTVSTRFHSRTW